MIYSKTEIGKRISRERKLKGYSQEELAYLVGLSKNQISSIECGKSSPKVSFIIRICDCLGGTPDTYLIGKKTKTTDELIELIRGLSEIEQDKLIEMLKIYRFYEKQDRQ